MDLCRWGVLGLCAVVALSLVSRAAAADGESDDRWAVLEPGELRAMLESYWAAMVKPRPFAYRTREEWLSRKRLLRRRILESLGLWPLPPRVPLDVRFGGRIEREDYVVRRIYFQTWPQVYASGYLYRPTEVSFPAPAVLCPHGHWAAGARDPVVQSRCIGLAKQGYVVLAVDSVHSYDYPIGVNPVGVMTWNNMRALDYLCSLREVDSRRIACTGASGGAQQTMYLAAVDDRVAAAAPVVMVSYFREIITVDGAHCACNHVPGIMKWTDEPEMAAMVAPRPQFFISVSGDWTAKFAQEGYPEIRRIYRLLGAADLVDRAWYDSGHDYGQPMREQVYAWFNRWLRGIADPRLSAEPTHQTEDPAALEALSAAIPGARGWEAVGEECRRLYGFRPIAVSDGESLSRYRSRQRPRLRALLGEDRPEVARRSPLAPKMVDSSIVGGYLVERLTFCPERHWRTPALAVGRVDGNSRRPAVVIVAPEGKASLMTGDGPGPLVRALADAGLLVLAIDARLRGELAHEWRLNCMIWGRPQIGMAAHDIVRAVDYLRTRGDVDADRVAVIGLGDQGAAAIFAAALDPRIAAVAADGEGEEQVANLLRHTDLAHLVGCLAPRRAMIHPRAGDDYRWAREAYRVGARGPALRLTRSPLAESPEAVARWVRAALR